MTLKKLLRLYHLITLSACLRQSILRIFPFWSGLERTHMAGFLPVIERTKSSRHSWAMSFRSFPRSLEAHFCFTSGFSAYKKKALYFMVFAQNKIPMLAIYFLQNIGTIQFYYQFSKQSIVKLLMESIQLFSFFIISIFWYNWWQPTSRQF